MMDPDDDNVYASSLVDKYEHRPNSLEDMCLADFCCNYVSKKVDNIESDEIRSYTIPVSSIDEGENDKKLQVIKLKNNKGEMGKRKRPCVIRFHKVSKLKNPEESYLRVLQLYLPWRKEDLLIGEFKTYQERYEEVKDDISKNIE